MPASASDSVRASAMTPTIVVQSGLARPKRPNKRHSLADRILALPLCRPVHAGRGLVDDCDQGRSFKVLVDEEASTQESHAQQVEVFGRDDRCIDQRRLAALHFLAFANQWNHSAIVLAMAEGNGRPITDGGFFHARNRPDAAQNFAQQHALPAWRCGKCRFWDR